jgi:sugar lactone lactonase YvrE
MAGSRLTPLLDGGRYFEAPRWHDHRLWLVDSVARTLISVTPVGTAEIACALNGMPAGLGFLPGGEAVVSDMHGRSLVRCADGQPIVHADLSELTGTLDDMTVDKTGRAYVGDLGFDPGRDPRAVADGLNFPNGIAISDDGRQLVVAETNGDGLASFRISADGSLDFDRRFGQFRAPDGIGIDRDQAVWVSLLDESSFVRVAPDGRVRDRIAVPGRRGIACVLGGADRKTLFCVSIEPGQGPESGSKSRSYVDAAVVEVPGAGYP